MTTQLSYLHSVLIINGERVTGFSEDDVPVELPDIDLSEAIFGQDGTMYTSGTAIIGGEVMVRLLPTSPAIPRFLRFHSEIQQGARIDFEGSWADPDLGYSTLMQGGVLRVCPPGISPNKTFEMTFDFEKLIPQFDGARFAPAAHS